MTVSPRGWHPYDYRSSLLLPANDEIPWLIRSLYTWHIPHIEGSCDKEVVVAAVRQAGFSLQYAHDKLKADKEVVLETVGCSGDAIEYVDK